MKKDIKKEIDDSNQKEEIDLEEENLNATGQILLGEIEKVGGILTANPLAQAEGDYNIEVGNKRKETAEKLIAQDSEEE